MQVIPKLGFHCSQQRLDQGVGLAKSLQEGNADVADVVVWYDDYDDFVKISFDLEGKKYLIRIYKIFTILVNDEVTAQFRLEHQVIDWFARKKYQRNK